MENEVTFPQDCDGRTIIPITPFPLFIKGLPGTATQLSDAISHYEYAAGTSTPIMDGALHNGSLTANTYGFWYNTPAAIPAGWVETHQNMYTTATMFAQAGTSATATNNTGETVTVGHQYKVSAIWAAQRAPPLQSRPMLHNTPMAQERRFFWHRSAGPGTRRMDTPYFTWQVPPVQRHRLGWRDIMFR